MFLIAVTKHNIIQNFESIDIKEFKVKSSIITVFTDNHSSKFIMDEDEFSIVESTSFVSVILPN